MNETDFIRQQLIIERAHLREILEAIHRSTPARPARTVQRYIDWAGARLVAQIDAHRAALRAAALDADSQQRLQRADAAARAAQEASSPNGHLHVQPLLDLVEAWSEPLDALAGRALRITHWRQAAQLSADTILEERQLFAAARSAAGLA
jgi:hypothetical protein